MQPSEKDKQKSNLEIKSVEKKKKVYVSPTIEVTEIRMEQGIAAGSVEVGSSGSETVPEVEDWEDGWQKGDEDGHFFDNI